MSTMGSSEIISPDVNSIGMSHVIPDPLRYDGQTADITEVAGLLRSMMPEHARVLDVGCGTGSVNIIVNREKNNSVTAIEPDRDRACLARSRGLDVHNVFLDQHFIDTHPAFDLVMASDVLEHVASPAQLLELMIKAARPGGYILISVPNVAHWSVRLNLLLGRFNYEASGIMDATHLRWFTEKTASNLVQASGCSIVEIRQTAGASLAVYHRGMLSKLPSRWRSRIVRIMTRIVPRLFGVQHVILMKTPL